MLSSWNSCDGWEREDLGAIVMRAGDSRLFRALLNAKKEDINEEWLESWIKRAVSSCDFESTRTCAEIASELFPQSFLLKWRDFADPERPLNIQNLKDKINYHRCVRELFSKRILTHLEGDERAWKLSYFAFKKGYHDMPVIKSDALKGCCACKNIIATPFKCAAFDLERTRLPKPTSAIRKRLSFG